MRYYLFLDSFEKNLENQEKGHYMTERKQLTQSVFPPISIFILKGPFKSDEKVYLNNIKYTKALKILEDQFS